VLELLLLINFSGLIFSSRSIFGLANPFQIYFLTWSLVFFGYRLSFNSYVNIDLYFLGLIFVVHFFAFMLMVGSFFLRKNLVIVSRGQDVEIVRLNYVFCAQFAVIVAIPFAYSRATIMSGDDIFSVIGYIRLRSSMTDEGQSFGLIGYFSTLAFVVCSTSAFLLASGRLTWFRFLISFATAIFYVYIGTGRTIALLFLILLFVPMILFGFIRFKGILLFSMVAVLLFLLIAMMTAKGLSVDGGLLENIESFSGNVRAYTIAPFLAISQLFEKNIPIDYGLNSFRIVFSILYALGLSDSLPVALIRDYVYVPDPTNVYTVYEVYFRDFGVLGFFLPPLFLLLHYFLYSKAEFAGGRWIFYYAASVYPLVMQFFQDQYFSLLSTWVQVAFWYWLFLRGSGVAFVKTRN
jgi:oligosaccharide repeat unit polymerase